MKKRITTSPGEMLVEEFLKPLGISQNQLALHTSLPQSRINRIIHGQRTLTAETALRFARFFGNSPEFWLNLQMLHDLSEAELALGKAIETEVRPYTRKVA
jgi:antitoxin HigA-1